MRKIFVCATFIIGLLLVANAYAFPGASIALSIGQWIVSGGEKVYYIQVEGRGENERQAQLNGFTVAIEKAVGTLVLSERESTIEALKRNDIIDYSSGVVKKYEILDHKNSDGEVVLKMDVWVAESSIVKRMKTLSVSNTNGSFDGMAMYREFKNRQALEDTDNIRKQKAKTLFANMMRDFPRNVFKADIGKTRLEYVNGSPRAWIDARLSFNREWIDAISDVSKRASDGSADYGCLGTAWTCDDRYHTFHIRDGWFGPFSETTYSFDDPAVAHLFIDAFQSGQTVMKMTFISSRGEHVACWNIGQHFRNRIYDVESLLQPGINAYVYRFWFLRANSSWTMPVYIDNNYDGLSNEEFLLSLPKKIEVVFAKTC